MSLSNCGTPGIPLPPSLEIPKPVKDLHAIRKGAKVFLTWTVPTQTTDRQTIRRLGITRICRVETPMKSEDSCLNEVGTVAAVESLEVHRRKQAKNLQTKTQQIFVDQFPQQANGDLTYAVEILNGRGRSAGLSNRVLISAAPTLPPPNNFAAQVIAAGVALTWEPPPQDKDATNRFVCRIYRREDGAKADALAGELPLSSPLQKFIDENIEWEKKYSYHATMVTIINHGPQAQIEGDDTPLVSIFTHDTFPPAIPSGLQAVLSGDHQQASIDLIWNADTEKDLAGYNVFRREQGDSTPTKINPQILNQPTFRDQNVLPGKNYYYSVSAVDVRGNESSHSQEANEIGPNDDARN